MAMAACRLRSDDPATLYAFWMTTSRTGLGNDRKKPSLKVLSEGPPLYELR